MPAADELEAVPPPPNWLPTADPEEEKPNGDMNPFRPPVVDPPRPPKTYGLKGLLPIGAPKPALPVAFGLYPRGLAGL